MSAQVYSFADSGSESGKTTVHFRNFEKMTRFCQMCTRRYSFWVAVAVFACLEPILCSTYPTIRIRVVQTFVLAVSTILYMIQLIGVATREWEKIVVIEAMARLGTISIKNPLKDFTALKLLVFFAAEGEYVLEGIMIAVGWILIWWRPGLATLRCFRVFRILWFYEVDVFRETTIRFFSPYFGTEFIVRGFKVLKFAINALTALGNEMFRLTAETRGALLLMMMFFYSAFVLGATLFVETNMNSDLCQSMGHCTWTLVRLTFFDGDGLDFAYYLTSDHRILFFIVMVYLCITSFGILNGLVGVFGTALARASHLAFEDEEDPQDDGMGESVSPMRGDDEEISSRDGDGNNGQNGTKDKLIDEDEVVESFKGDVDPAPLFATAGPAGQAPGMTDDMKKSLRDILRGPSSRFAVEHFTKAADANAASSVADGTQSPAHGASNFGRMFGGGTPGKRRITIKDVARAVSSHNNNRPTGISVCDEPVEPRPLRAKPSAAPGTFANMFAVGGNGANRPLPAKSSRNLLGHHGSTQVAMLGGDGRSLMAGVAELHSKVDRQTKLINLLLRQVGTLTKQLEKVVPDFEASMDGNDVSSVMSSGYNVKDLLLDDTLDANPVASPAPSTARSGALGGVGLGSMSSGGRGSGTGGGMTGLLNRMKKPTAAAPAPVPSAAVAPAPMAPAAAAPAEPVHHPSPFNAAPTVLVDSMLEESSVVDEDGTGQPLYEAEQPPREDDRIQDFTES